MLERYVKKYGEKKAEDAGARADLVKITEAAPWSEEAWKAVEWLGK
jgi:hypothetical protein